MILEFEGVPRVEWLRTVTKRYGIDFAKKSIDYGVDGVVLKAHKDAEGRMIIDDFKPLSVSANYPKKPAQITIQAIRDAIKNYRGTGPGKIVIRKDQEKVLHKILSSQMWGVPNRLGGNLLFGRFLEFRQQKELVKVVPDKPRRRKKKKQSKVIQ